MARSLLRWVWRTHGLWLILTAFVIGVGGYVVAGRLAEVAKTLEAEDLYVREWVRTCLDARAWIAVPALGIALCGLLVGRSRWPLVWLALGAMLVLVVAALMLGCLVGTLSPLYQPQVI